MITQKQIQETAQLLQVGLEHLVRFLEGDGPEQLRSAGERLHLIPKRRRLGPVPIVLGLLGAAAIVGLLIKSNGQNVPENDLV